MQYVPFVIGTKPYCVWGSDLRSRNLHFLSTFEPKYFEYLANTHVGHLDTEHAQFAALALRQGFHHGLETFFALVAAALQAPDYVLGWFLHYRPAELRQLAEQISAKSGTILNKLHMTRVSWRALATVVHRCARFGDQARTDRTVELFGALWQRLAHDFVNSSSNHEYNSIKHGLRAKPGGFSISAGLEPSYGVSPPPEEMHPIGGSVFGSSFYRAERLGPQGDPNFRVVDHGMNWNPTALAHALVLLSISIGNVLSFLRIVNGTPPTNVRFTRPQQDDFFESPWKNVPTLSSCTFGEQFEAVDIERKSAAEIIAFYKRTSKAQKPEDDTPPDAPN